jgi:CBS domain-containing protein
MKIAELKPRSAISVTEGDSLRFAAKHLADDEIGVLIVFDARGPAGIFSERDLVRAVADGADLDDEPVDEYMTKAPVSVDENSGLGDAIAKMNEFGVRHLLVLEEKEVVGVISVRDILALLGTGWPEL